MLLYPSSKIRILYQDMSNLEIVEESRKMNTSVKHQWNKEGSNKAKMDWFDWFDVQTLLEVSPHSPPIILRRQINHPIIQQPFIEHLLESVSVQGLGMSQDKHSLPPWSLYSASGDRLHRKWFFLWSYMCWEEVGQGVLSGWPCNGGLT